MLADAGRREGQVFQARFRALRIIDPVELLRELEQTQSETSFSRLAGTRQNASRSPLRRRTFIRRRLRSFLGLFRLGYATRSGLRFERVCPLRRE
jgi:hypothetical protein